jgi:electron transfer flavoprotein alpha subunit
MSVLLIADILEGQLNLDQTAKALSAARQLGEVTVLCASINCTEAVNKITMLEGVSEVLVADDAVYARGLAEPLADLIKSLATDFTHILSAATALGKNVMPRIAALLDVMIISDVTEIISLDTFERPIYAGNALQTVQSVDAIKVCTIRTAGFLAVNNGSAVASIRAIELLPLDPNLSVWLEDAVQESNRPELTSAKIVVSGGRGVGSKDNFEIIEKLADKLGAAVGASRAAVDSGYAPNDWQVGQTGKVVAPDLYLAIGISGAIQHLAGMKDSKIIVAINKDEDAPIFQVADYGLVADLFEAVSELETKL